MDLPGAAPWDASDSTAAVRVLSRDRLVAALADAKEQRAQELIFIDARIVKRDS